MNYLLIGLLAFVAVLGTEPTTTSTGTPEACTCGQTTPHAPKPATLTDAGCNGGWMEN